MDGALVLGIKPWNATYGVGVVVGEGRERNTYKVAWIVGSNILKCVEHRECFAEISGGQVDGKAHKAA